MTFFQITIQNLIQVKRQKETVNNTEDSKDFIRPISINTSTPINYKKCNINC